MTVVQILCDNSISGSSFREEHGFSAFIEFKGSRYLFDTGQGGTLPHNAAAAGVTLDGIDAVFLSHGHYDHTGGLAWVLSQAGPTTVVAHERMFDHHMGRNPNNPSQPRYVGCPDSRESLERAGARFEFHNTPFQFAPGVRFITGYPRTPDQTPNDGKLVLPENGGFVPDPIASDAGLLLDTGSGYVLVLGCAHGGVLNFLDYLETGLGIDRLYAILGGTHLMFFGVDQIRQVIDRFESFHIQQVGVSHCTGERAAAILANHFGDRFAHAAAGSKFVF